ncbi:heat shock protein transcriptional repressor HspR [Spelaeicoccus albus]|uniref:MerR family transcriptional regulator/heat shock protein HspR n=1 Tax=Spelaeicoccus albus TaxID=1280376 RepID=A0A7Z0CZC5_9MICO|nr:helix-turn-helix transcriptional regulator [Spelaeicoccus albus]NYI66191.1 MerR family transcriptional regulator/heat shock protein HspR [Spelaeicoccus albus]
MRPNENAAVYVISVAAELAGMHPQTLRQYDRLGLVTPDRTAGRGRRYSARDIVRLQEVQRLSQEDGVNLAGIKRIMALEHQVEVLQAKARELAEELERVKIARDAGRRVFAAGESAGDIVSLARGERPSPRSSALVLWQPAWPRRR